jgi:acetyl-CoA carboxylase biotin carboxylase subunit
VAAAGVPVAAGSSGAVAAEETAVAAAETVGFPVMLKAAAGGGGMGMAIAADAATLRTEYTRLSAFAQRLFGDPRLFVERYFPRVRHVEVQILGLADGRVVALGERDCSVQRRHQKLVEESPSPAVSPDLRNRMEQAAVLAARTVDYRGAGTVEFLLDQDTGEFFFLEMNTRLQVEHPVTEMRHGVAEWVEPAGDGIRVDSGYTVGNTVTPFFDSLLAKLVVHGADRPHALQQAREAVTAFTVTGPKCNLPFHIDLLAHPDFITGHYDTGLVSRMRS